MDKQKANTIIEMAVGMKHSEWQRIADAVERKFRDAEARIYFTEEMAWGAAELIELADGD